MMVRDRYKCSANSRNALGLRQPQKLLERYPLTCACIIGFTRSPRFANVPSHSKFPFSLLSKMMASEEALILAFKRNNSIRLHDSLFQTNTERRRLSLFFCLAHDLRTRAHVNIMTASTARSRLIALFSLFLGVPDQHARTAVYTE